MGKRSPCTTITMPDGQEIYARNRLAGCTGRWFCRPENGQYHVALYKDSQHENCQRKVRLFFPLSVDYQEKYASVDAPPG
ncbi:MAG: hypothetical protein R2778_10590 [Saprospiraceae bacterium]